MQLAAILKLINILNINILINKIIGLIQFSYLNDIELPIEISIVILYFNFLSV